MNSPFLEIACGPGMGLAPLILNRHPDVPCLVSDACSLVISSWRKYLDANSLSYDISLASFSAFGMPIESASLDCVTSFIGISSTRSGADGQRQAIDEVFRVLKSGGLFLTVECGWRYDRAELRRVFELWGRPVWGNICDEPDGSEKTLSDRFSEAGFIVESADETYSRTLTADDNELCKQAVKYGVKLESVFTLYILRKQ